MSDVRPADLELVAPRINTAIRSARGLFPFLGGRQTAPRPTAELFCLTFKDEGNGEFIFARRITVTGFEHLITTIRNFEAVDVKGGHKDLAQGLFIGFRVRRVTAHPEFS